MTAAAAVTTTSRQQAPGPPGPEVRQVQAAGVVVPGDQQIGDEEPAEHEEDVDAEKPAAQPGPSAARRRCRRPLYRAARLGSGRAASRPRWWPARASRSPGGAGRRPDRTGWPARPPGASVRFARARPAFLRARTEPRFP